jgi:hypothetical protein
MDKAYKDGGVIDELTYYDRDESRSERKEDRGMPFFQTTPKTHERRRSDPEGMPTPWRKGDAPQPQSLWARFIQWTASK